MNLDRIFERALSLHQRGNPREAEKLYGQILDLAPDDFGANLLLGMMRNDQGRYHEALEFIARALRANPSSDIAYLNQGIAFSGCARCDEALASYEKALILNPSCVEALNNRGLLLAKMGQKDLARASYELALNIKPDFAEALNNRGNLFQEISLFEEALINYDQALGIRPDYPEALNNRANALRALDRAQEALASLNKALSIEPRYVDAIYNRALTFFALKRYEEALQDCDKALKIEPYHAPILNARANILRKSDRALEALADHDSALALTPANAEFLNDRGNTLQDLGRYPEALKDYEKALVLRPDYVEALNNRGSALRDLMQLDGALQSFDRAIALDPDNAQAHWCKSFCKLLKGEFEEGFSLYEWRKRLADPIELRGYDVPIWNGSQSIRGKTIFIYHEQGLGDAIQFYRYIPLLEDRGARAILSVQDCLLPLFRAANPALELLGQRCEPKAFDYHSPLMSLPHAFATARETVPAEVPYLMAEAARIEKWASRMGGGGFKIGVCWQGAPKTMAGRSFPVSWLEKISQIEAVRLISLQKGPGLEQLASRPEGLRLEVFEEEFDSAGQAFIDSAAIIANLDLVISLDTSIAHLAGALGRPVWVALKHVPDWRWLLSRSDTPWYPTMRLFRQLADGDWSNVFEEMQNEICAVPGGKD